MFLSSKSRNSSSRRQSPKVRRDSAIRMAVENLEDRTLFSFATPVSYAAGAPAVSMLTGDFNADGRADVLTTNSAPAGVTVLLGNGDGTFGAPLTSSLGAVSPGSRYTGSQAGTSAVGDFNGDGRLDVSVMAGNNAITLMGNGDGTFGAPLTTLLGFAPSRMSTGDVNGDGITDLLAANTTGTVSVVIGAGDGTFAAPVEYAAGPQAQDVKAVDLNHDGKQDLVVADAVSAGTVSTLMGNGDGTFQAYHSYAAFSAPYRMTIGDYNGDGNQDVAVANSYTSSCITILLGNPDGTFKPYQSYDTGSQPWELESGDLDGDGKDDLISSNGSSYQTQMNNGDGTFSASVSSPGAGLVFAAEDFNGDGTIDVAGANGFNIGVMINNNSAITNVSTATGFALSSPATTGAGTPLPLTISAVDADGNVVADFLGTVHVVTTDPRMHGFTYTFTAADAGTHTFNTGVALFTLGSQTLTANGPAALTGSETVTVTAAAASRFTITADATAVAGSPASFTVTAQDAFGNLATGYTGTVHFTSNDPQGVLSADYTFTAADNGVASFSAVLKTAGTRTITATDTANGMVRGTSSTLITADVATSIGIIGGGGHIGSPHIVTVTAYDAYGNIATGDNATIHLTGSDAQIVLPATDGLLVNGIGNFTVTPMTLGAQTLTATDVANPAMLASETIVGTPGDASRFVITSISGGTAGTAQTITVTAYDSFGNVAVDYSGTILFSSSDYQATLPYYTFTNADVGTHTFTVTLRTAGTQSLTVRDLYNPAITSMQTGIVITSAAPATIAVMPLHGTVAGVAQNFTISARDIYGNVASDYRGTLNFSTSDTLATFLPSYTFTAADNGLHIFSITLKNAGGQTFVVQDTATASMASSQRDIQVTPAAMAGFSFRAPSNATAGTAFSVTLSAVDAYGNVIPNYVGKVHFSGPSGGGNILPTDYTFTAADGGVHAFLVTFASTGTQTLGVADLANTGLKGSISMTVKSSGGSGGGGGTGGGSGGGGKKIV
ncbi:MAG: hypothetical protein JWN40_3682 [Phycisphaerales bacterium]|nr:hypothetical protein [Phycisphaerales bacterium]